MFSEGLCGLATFVDVEFAEEDGLDHGRGVYLSVCVQTTDGQSIGAYMATGKSKGIGIEDDEHPHQRWSGCGPSSLQG